jgi:hypothetical protein
VYGFKKKIYHSQTQHPCPGIFFWVEKFNARGDLAYNLESGQNPFSKQVHVKVISFEKKHIFLQKP